MSTQTPFLTTERWGFVVLIQTENRHFLEFVEFGKTAITSSVEVSSRQHNPVSPAIMQPCFSVVDIKVINHKA